MIGEHYTYDRDYFDKVQTMYGRHNTYCNRTINFVSSVCTVPASITHVRVGEAVVVRWALELIIKALRCSLGSERNSKHKVRDHITFTIENGDTMQDTSRTGIARVKQEEEADSE